MNGLTLLALIAILIGLGIAYRTGVIHGRREPRATLLPRASARVHDGPAVETPKVPTSPIDSDTTTGERARLIRSYESEAAALRARAAVRLAEVAQLRAFAEERRALYRAIADARTETARLRQIVVDIENNAPPTLFDVPGSPDDLKLIVGIGPVLERMLHQLGIGTYRQIALWTEHDIDAFDAKLAEFPGRIRRDAWVTQARELHLSKYGERP